MAAEALRSSPVTLGALLRLGKPRVVSLIVFTAIIGMFLATPGMVAPQVLNLMRLARGMGLGQDDSSSVIKVYESALGKQARLKK